MQCSENKRVQLKYCFVVAGGELRSICTESSDCNYEAGFCLKFDQCHVSWCYCKSGYTQDEGMCKKRKLRLLE